MTAAEYTIAALDALPRHGWVRRPASVTPLPGLAAHLGLRWLCALRDDQLGTLGGGTEVRKLDYVLASPPFVDASAWAASGAMGSGVLVAAAAAASALRRELHAHIFWTPPTPRAVEYLAFVASRATRIHAYRGRIELAMKAPRVLFGRASGGMPVIPPGAASPAGIVGVARAAAEISRRIELRELPRIDRIIVPVASAGTLVGLGWGFALAGYRPRLQAIAVVERPLFGTRRVARLLDEVHRWTKGHGLRLPRVRPEALRIRIDRTQLGPGYGVPTSASLAACDALGELPLEPVSSGKAMAALLAGVARPGERVLFWVTPRRAGEIPCDHEWRQRLPPSLAGWLERGARQNSAAYERPAV